MRFPPIELFKISNSRLAIFPGYVAKLGHVEKGQQEILVETNSQRLQKDRSILDEKHSMS